MSFSAAELVATIQLGGVTTADRELDRFRGKLEQADVSASRLSKAAKAAFTGAATTIGVASTAAAVYVTKLLNTGIAYNTLQQTSRAALKTLVGGAEAANEQMNQLDAFARTSPFSKAVFITAQQQLIGFGVEAKKVIPTLDAIQQAVAATGGSSQQVGEIAFVLAQIQSASKITAQDLMQLGQRGINAAELIGGEMGKTGAQIKEQISDGALSAEDALDALTAGMAKKFAGASANVKGTISGTVDRINAASREIGAALAEPFVSQQGGGLAVTWGNQVADVMQAVRGHTAPVVSMLTGRMQPAVATVTEALDRARVVVKAWNSARLEAGLDAIGDHAPAIAAVAGAILGVNTQLLAGIPVVGRFVPSFGPLAGAIGAAALASPELREELSALLGQMQPLLPVAGEVATVFSGVLNQALPVVSAGVSGLTAVAGPLVGVLKAIPSPILAMVAAGLGANAMMRAGRPLIQGWVDGVRRIGEQVAVQRALAAMEGNTSKFAGTLGIAGKAATGFGNSLKAAFISNPVGLVILGVSTAASLLTAAFAAQAQKAQDVKDRIQGYRETLSQTTGDLTEATAAQIEKNLAEKDAVDAARELGISNAAAAQAILDGGPAYDAIIEKLKAMKDAAYEADAEAAKRGARTDNMGQISRLIDSYESERAAIVGAQEALRTHTEDQRRVAAAMTDTQRSNERLNAALAIARDTSADATERLRALKQALDELNGGTKTQADLTRDLNEQGLRLEAAFAATDDKGKKLAKGLVDVSGNIDTTTSAGIAMYDEVSRLNDEMLDAILLADKHAKARGEEGVSVEEATAKSQPYIDKLREIADGAGLSESQVDGLIGTMISTPSVVSFLISSDGTIDAEKQRLLILAQEIQNTPDGKFTVSSDDFPGLKDALASLGIDITTLPKGTVKVEKDNGTFESVRQALNGLAKPRTVRVSVSGPSQSNPFIDEAHESGGLWADGIRAFASGGMPFPSGIYRGRPEAIHKFAEGSLPWEAYISPHPAHREKNKKIVKEVASRFGGVAAFEGGGISSSYVTAFASGGFVKGGWTLSEELRDMFRDLRRDWNTGQRRGENRRDLMNGNAMSVIDKLFAMSYEIGKKGGEKLRKEALRAEKQFLRLEKESKAADKAVSAARDRLNSLKDTVSAMASAISSKIRAALNVGDWQATTGTKTVTKTRTVDGVAVTTASQQKVDKPLTAGKILKDAKAKAAAIKRFAQKLEQLGEKGYDPGLIREIAELGLDGEPAADALLAATKKQRKSINEEYAKANKWADKAGMGVAKSQIDPETKKTYEKLIEKAEKQLDEAKKNRTEIKRELKAQTNRLIKVIGDGYKAGANATVKKKKALGGPIIGPGTATSDSIDARLSNGENVWEVPAVQRWGGQANVERLKRGEFPWGGPATGAPGSTAYAGPQLPPIYFVNPQHRDVQKDAREAAQIIAAGVMTPRL